MKNSLKLTNCSKLSSDTRKSRSKSLMVSSEWFPRKGTGVLWLHICFCWSFVKQFLKYAQEVHFPFEFKSEMLFEYSWMKCESLQKSKNVKRFNCLIGLSFLFLSFRKATLQEVFSGLKDCENSSYGFLV